jgi:hypothetical protein
MMSTAQLSGKRARQRVQAGTARLMSAFSAVSQVS